MKRLGHWLIALCLLGLVVAWAMPSGASVPPGYEPQVKLLNPQDYQNDSGNHSGKAAFANGEVSAKQAKSGGFWGWLGDHGMGLVKGIGAGLIGAGIVVAAAAVLIGAGAPLLLMAGAAIIGGAIYGAIVGSARFNWNEAIIGSVIGGVSAGVGSWIAGSASPVIARAGVALTNMVSGGVASLSSYLIQESHPTWGGAATAFGIGAGTAALFMAGGAVVSKGLSWAKGALGFGGAAKSTPTAPMVDAALEGTLPGHQSTGASSLTATRSQEELRSRVLQNIQESQRARAASGFSEYAKLEAQIQDIANWRAGHGYQYDLFTEGQLPIRYARNFAGMKYTVRTLEEDVTLYRAGKAGNPYGEWFTYKAPVSESQVRIDGAVKPQWIDRETGSLTGISPIEMAYALKIPKGTTIFEGPVASQGGIYLGGEDVIQVFVPKTWELTGVEVKGVWRIAK